MNELSPVWKGFKLNGQKLCSGDADRAVVAAVYDWDKDGTHDLIGMVSASWRDLEKAFSTGVPLKLRHPDKGGNALVGGKHAGNLFVSMATLSDEEETALKALHAETHLNMCSVMAQVCRARVCVVPRRAVLRCAVLFTKRAVPRCAALCRALHGTRCAALCRALHGTNTTPSGHRCAITSSRSPTRSKPSRLCSGACCRRAMSRCVPFRPGWSNRFQ